MTERKIVTPGEVIFSGEDYLPGKGTEKKGNEIVANVFGLAEEENNLEEILNDLKVSVKEKNNESTNNLKNAFNHAVSEYRRIMGRNETQKYLNNYREIIKK